MKQLLTILFILILSNVLFAQDVIIKKTGDEINSKVLEITSESIKYKEYDFLEGPIRNISISDVFMVIYENGKREKFTTAAPTTTEQKQEVEIKKEKEQYSKENKFYSQLKEYNQEGGYFSFAVGYGISYGELGLRVQYVTKGKTKIGFHGGVGILPEYHGAELMYSGGVQYYFWKQMYANVQFGVFGVTYEEWFSSYYGETYEEDGLLIGPSFMIGYDWFFSKHFGFNIGAGASYDINSNSGVWFASDAGLIIRF